MEENNLWEVSINISDAFLCEFDAESSLVKRGVYLREKKYRKKKKDLYDLAIFRDLRSMMFRTGDFAYIFKIEEGDIDNFAAGFKVSWFGHPGRVLFKNK